MADGLDLLVCAATIMELRTFAADLDEAALRGDMIVRGTTGFFLTGVGIPSALAAVITFAERERPPRLLTVGIAGAYPGSGLKIGDVVMGADEVYGDIGFELPPETAQETPGFRSVNEAPWEAFYREPLPLTRFEPFGDIPMRRGCTVNCCTGTEATGNRRESLFDAAFETMEGAAVAQAGQLLGIPVCEIRAISNYAARRDMQPANIQIALDRLRDYFAKCRENSHA